MLLIFNKSFLGSLISSALICWGIAASGEYMSKKGKCHFCDPTCLQCTGPETEACTACPDTRFFEDGRCVIHCQAGRYAAGKQCLPCHHTCKACTDEGPDNCTSCGTDRFDVPRYLFESQCREACPEGFFHSAMMRCEQCPPECIICVAADRCVQCSPGYKLKNSHCVQLECSTGKVSNQEDGCLPCDEGCNKCKLDDSGDQKQKTVCMECEDGYYQLDNDCHQSCPDGTYDVKETMTCSPCEDKHCAVCDQSQCYWCDDGFFVSDGECVDHCPEGYFVDKGSLECEPCHRDCRSCGGPRFDDCDSCEDGFTLKDGECLSGKQLAVCPETQFRNSQDKCEPCHSSCKSCFAAGKENCSSCNPGRFLTLNHTCVSRCPSGNFGNKTSGQCDPCRSGCVMCKEAQACQRCHTGLHLQNGACVVECQRGFPQGDECHPCAPECGSCKERPSNCLSCERPFLLLDNSCMSSCPKGFYDNNTECHRCPNQCSECSQDGLCEKCANYYFLHKAECVDDCPKGYFASEPQQECMQCHADCASCDGPGEDDCDVCRNPKAVRYNGECLARCPNSTYYDEKTNECRACDKSCLTCSGHEPTVCLSCGTNRRLDDTGHCVWYSECSMNSYVGPNGDCQQCHTRCLRCDGPGEDHCLSCKEPRFLLNTTCVKKCPVGYYEDKAGRGCERCHFSCESCDGHHSQQCTTCKPGFFKQAGSCVETCSESHFGNKTTLLCERCDPSCSQCVGTGNRNCLSCRDGYVYMGQWGQCLKSCPQGYYKDIWSMDCHKCHPTCKTCKDGGALDCLSCYDGFTFEGGFCDNPCFIGFYPASKDSKRDDPNCRTCHPSCEGCWGPSMLQCTMCPASKILSDDGRCLSCCGNKTPHEDKPITRECCDCEASLMQCVLGVNFVMRSAEDSESSARLIVTICVMVILFLGGGIFLFLTARSKWLTIKPKTKAGGYQKLDTNDNCPPQPTHSSFGDYSNRITECENNHEEYDDEDIVYMTKDGTVYRKFKYGLLDDDDVELEYDDESYSFR